MSEEKKKAINNMELFARVHQNMAVVTAKEMDTVLKLVERLQKENEELKYKYNKALSDVIAGVDLDNTYISKQKVKDKIEELKQKAISYGPFIDKDESFNIESKISILQELLERRK